MSRTKKSPGTIFPFVLSFALICLMTAVMIPGVMGGYPETDLTLNTADHFAILSYSGITNTGSHGTLITGDIGSSPITAAAMDGVWCSEMNGYTIYGVDAAYTGSGVTTCFHGTPADKTLVDLAYANSVTAYGEAAGRTLPTATELGSGHIGGMTLAPGLYKWSGDVNIDTATDLTLDAQGDPTAVWIFQSAGGLHMAANTHMILANGARAEHIYWQVGGTPGAVINAGAHAEGNILAYDAINLLTGASLNGRAYSQAAAAGVTLDASTITLPTVSPPIHGAPNITSITPPGGSLAGGTLITIHGTDLNTATAVTIDDIPVLFSYVSPTSVTATTLAHAAGPVGVKVTTLDGSFHGLANLTNGYTYALPPTYASITPAFGPTTAGTPVTINGADFNPTIANVTIGGAPATSVVWVSANQITADAPAGTTGARDVVITNPDLQSGTGAGVYTYADAPTVTGRTPIYGPTIGGNTVIITGSGFTGVTGVSFGTVPAVYTVDSTTQITATAPASVPAGTVGTYHITVTTSGTSATSLADQYTYALPTVTSVTPVTGSTSGLTQVNITGSGFTGATGVTFDGIAGTGLVLINDTAISVIAPAHATVGAVDIIVTTPDGTGTGTGAYTYAPPSPSVVNLGTAGNYVILTKSGISSVVGSGTRIVGDIGVSPIAATGITGFDLTADASNVFSTSARVIGKIFAADYAPPTPATMSTAVSDMVAAYNEASTRPLPDHTELGAGNIGGMTLAPGLYKWGTGVTIPTDVTLSGGANEVWIFQIAQGLSINSDKKVILTGGAQPSNIFWVVEGQTTLGSGSEFNGVILDKTAIVMDSGAKLYGRALAQTAVTLIGNAVNVPIPTVVVLPTIIADSGDTSGLGPADSQHTNNDVTALLAPVLASGETPVKDVTPLTSKPLVADLIGMPGVAASWTINYNDNPAEDAKITTVIRQYVEQSTLDAFTTALHNVGLDLGSLAYVMYVQKTGVASTGPAEIRMTASQYWVSSNGGVDAIRIVKIGENGAVKVLDTSFEKYDRDSGYLTFKATSSDGLGGTFGLIGVVPYTQQVIVGTVGQTPGSESQRAPSQVPGASTTTTTSGIPMMAIGGVLAALTLIGIATMTIIRRNKGSK